MKPKPHGTALVALLWIITSAALSASEINITDRSDTDPLLKIKTNTHFLSEKADKKWRIVPDENHVPPVYKRLWGRQDVIMLEPLSREEPAEMDFSAITQNHKGVLRLVARNHYSGDFKLEILKGGQTIEKERIGNSQWERFSIPFDHEEVVIKSHASGWHYEFGFFDYSIVKVP